MFNNQLEEEEYREMRRKYKEKNRRSQSATSRRT
jgi:hypothetical protein